jgi:hypothetical protein
MYGLVAGLVYALVDGVVAGAFYYLVLGPALQQESLLSFLLGLLYVLVFMLVLGGLVAALAVGRTFGRGSTRPATRWARLRGCVVFGLVFAFAVLPEASTHEPLLVSGLGGLVAGTAAWFGRMPGNLTMVASPGVVLARDRRRALTIAACGGIALAAWFSLSAITSYGLASFGGLVPWLEDWPVVWLEGALTVGLAASSL